ncbi:MAG: conserved phage C-terminal domain-containing protein [Planctomycetes bacterium]|nr:conserved phage C-terminal domain-containing protein [Planctomycetota bacterium]
MARIRTIKPEFYTDSKTGSLSGNATKLFIGMLTFSDDYGVIEHDLAALKAKIFPYAIGSASKVITKPLDEILKSGLVLIFKWDKNTYFWIKNFTKHQKVDRPGKPLIENFTIDKLLNLLNSSNPRESSPCSVVEGSVVEGSVVEGKGEESSVVSGKPTVVEQVVSHLNTILQTDYKSNGKKTKALIEARLNEGRTLEDFKKVVDIKFAEWNNNPKMHQFLRPETLFGPKFESYLNQKPPPKVMGTDKTQGNWDLIARRERDRQEALKKQEAENAGITEIRVRKTDSGAG